MIIIIMIKTLVVMSSNVAGGGGDVTDNSRIRDDGTPCTGDGSDDDDIT